MLITFFVYTNFLLEHDMKYMIPIYKIKISIKNNKKRKTKQ